MKKLFLMFLLIAITALVFSDEIDEVMELLAAERGGEILYLSRINLGIPGGDNWIANRNDGSGGTFIYTINDDREVEYIGGLIFAEQSEIRYWDRNTNTYIDLEYDFMNSIPGTRIGSKAANFGDFNGDGKDEIFEINPYLAYCSIIGFDIESDKRPIKITPYKELTAYWLCSFDFISSKESAPVFFTRYLGTDGILIHTADIRGQFYWIFFTWDEESRKYVELIRIPADEIDWSMFPSEKDESRQNNNEPAVVESVVSGNEEENALEKTTASTPADSGKSTKSILYIVIISGIAALAAVVVFIVLRMKKK